MLTTRRRLCSIIDWRAAKSPARAPHGGGVFLFCGEQRRAAHVAQVQA
jgi:hypothetical protein